MQTFKRTSEVGFSAVSCTAQESYSFVICSYLSFIKSPFPFSPKLLALNAITVYSRNLVAVASLTKFLADYTLAMLATKGRSILVCDIVI